MSGRWTESTIADFITQLGAHTDTGALTQAVRKALGDPTAAVGFWLPDQRCYLDDRGVRLEPPTERTAQAVIEVEDHGEPAAMLIHDASASHDSRLVGDVTRALRMSVGNARLRTRVRSGVIALGLARRRLVEAADSQRRLLQANLDEGPQRRLHEVTRILQRTHDQAAPSERVHLQAIMAEVAETRSALRDLAEGVRPAALETGGLHAALSLLVPHTHPVQINVSVTKERMPAAVEGAIYFVCAEALTNVAKHSQASHAWLDIAVGPGEVTARIADDGCGAVNPNGSGIRGLRDRVEALGGSLSVGERRGGGTAVQATIPMEGAS